ncbi:MAG: ABC transporter substrate-binding protein [Ilumatobacteraceae bacterium]
MIKFHKAGVARLFLSATVFLAACGSSGASSDTTVAVETTITETTIAEATYPVTVGELTLDAQPVRIVSLSPTATEMLYAIGAGSQVVAVDDYSNYPQEAVALGTALSGYQPNVEAISGYTPDLVVISYDPGGLVDQLKSLGIPVYIGNAASSFDNVYEQIEQLGVLTGHTAQAVQLSSQLQADIAAAVADVVIPDTPLSYYYELDNTYYSVTSNTFVGQVFALFGLRNIADTAEGGSDYPQLSAEAIVSSDPDLIFLADTKYGNETAKTVGARAGWSGLKAVTAGNVIELDDDIASRWGPRLIELVKAVGAAISKALVNS